MLKNEFFQAYSLCLDKQLLFPDKFILSILHTAFYKHFFLFGAFFVISLPSIISKDNFLCIFSIFSLFKAFGRTF